MSREEAILEAIREIAPDKEKDILDRAEQITTQPQGRKKPLPSLDGIWADLKIDLSEEDLREARREMWKNFPRDFPEDET
jgi:hypothetical protein